MKYKKCDYRIEVYPSEASQLDMFYLYINNKFISAYLSRKDARQKVFNYITKYRYCIKENEIKNVMFHSNNNSHNSII